MVSGSPLRVFHDPSDQTETSPSRHRPRLHRFTYPTRSTTVSNQLEGSIGRFRSDTPERHTVRTTRACTSTPPSAPQTRPHHEMNPFGGTPRCPRCEKLVYAAEQVMGPARKVSESKGPSPSHKSHRFVIAYRSKMEPDVSQAVLDVQGLLQEAGFVLPCGA